MQEIFQTPEESASGPMLFRPCCTQPLCVNSLLFSALYRPSRRQRHFINLTVRLQADLDCYILTQFLRDCQYKQCGQDKRKPQNIHFHKSGAQEYRRYN